MILATIARNLDRMVAKEKISAEDKEATLGRLKTHTSLQDCAPASDLVVEAATENADLKAKIFQELD